LSTSYYALRVPVVRVEQPNPRLLVYTLHDDYDIQVGELRSTTLHLAADRDVKVAHRSDGVIVVTHPGPDDMQAISDYGELVTLGQLRRGEAP